MAGAGGGILGKCTVCLCLHLSLSLSPCVFFCSLKIQTPASCICIYIPTSQRPRSLVAAFVRAPRLPWVSIRHLFHVLCSSTIVLLPKVCPFASSWGFSFQVQFPSVLKLFFSFIFFPNFHFCFKLNPLMSAASFFSASSFLPLDHVSHSFLFFPVTLHPPPFLPSPSIPQISSYHHRFHFLCHFLSLPAFALLYSAPTVEQMKNTTLKRPFPPMFSACLLQNSRAL